MIGTQPTRVALGRIAIRLVTIRGPLCYVRSGSIHRPPGEPTEIHIGGAQLGAVFDRQSTQMSVAGQISRRSQRRKQLAKDEPMAICGMRDRQARLLQPSINDIHRLGDDQRPIEHRGPRREPGKADQDLPCESDGARTRQSLIKPRLGGPMAR